MGTARTALPDRGEPVTGGRSLVYVRPHRARAARRCLLQLFKERLRFIAGSPSQRAGTSDSRAATMGRDRERGSRLTMGVHFGPGRGPARLAPPTRSRLQLGTIGRTTSDRRQMEAAVNTGFKVPPGHLDPSRGWVEISPSPEFEHGTVAHTQRVSAAQATGRRDGSP